MEQRVRERRRRSNRMKVFDTYSEFGKGKGRESNTEGKVGFFNFSYLFLYLIMIKI